MIKLLLSVLNNHLYTFYIIIVSHNKINLTLSAMILKLFDSLTPLDQLLLKTASVLGEIVNRRMLYSLLEDITMREIGLGKNQHSLFIKKKDIQIIT